MASKRRTTLVIPGSLAERLAEVADDYGYTQSAILRDLIRDHLDDLADQLEKEAEEEAEERFREGRDPRARRGDEEE